LRLISRLLSLAPSSSVFSFTIRNRERFPNYSTHTLGEVLLALT
jgi:hypothetical protein